jgi:hypothetical protein
MGDALAFLLVIAVFGAVLVVCLAQLIRQSPRFARLPIGLLLALIHTLIMCGWLALSPLYIAAGRATDSPYGDVFVPYLLVPGFHIYNPASVWFGRVAGQVVRSAARSSRSERTVNWQRRAVRE